jgi:hypothetical protein
MANPPSAPHNPLPPRRADGAATRERLMRAALELFTRRAITAALRRRRRACRNRRRDDIAPFRRKTTTAQRSVPDFDADFHPAGARNPETPGMPGTTGANGDPLARDCGPGARAGSHRLPGADPWAAGQAEPRCRRGAQGRGGNDHCVRKAAGQVRPGAVEIWADIWLQLVSLMLERVANKEWPPDQPTTQLVIEAAWAAIGVQKGS